MDIIHILQTFIIIYIAYRQWRTDDKSRRYLLAERYARNYYFLRNAISLVIKKGKVDNEALALFWQAKDDARLLLDTEITQFTEKLCASAQKYLDNSQNSDFLKELMDLKLYKKYRKYIEP